MSSQDLRERVLRAIDAGMPRTEIVKTYAISPATIKRYLKQRRETGNLKPKAIPGRPAHILCWRPVLISQPRC